MMLVMSRYLPLTIMTTSHWREEVAKVVDQHTLRDLPVLQLNTALPGLLLDHYTRKESKVAVSSYVLSRRWHGVPYTVPPAVWQYISVDNTHCVYSASSCINFAYNFQNLYNDIKNKNVTLKKGGGCNIITNLHLCETHPFYCVRTCVGEIHVWIFLSRMLIHKLWLIMIQVLKLLSGWVFKLDTFAD